MHARTHPHPVLRVLAGATRERANHTAEEWALRARTKRSLQVSRALHRSLLQNLIIQRVVVWYGMAWYGVAWRGHQQRLTRGKMVIGH